MIYTLWQQVDQDEVEKKIKTAAELARRDESKKWQHKIEILKNRLTEADGEVSKLSKTNNSLRYSLNKDFVNYLIVLYSHRYLILSEAKGETNLSQTLLNEVFTYLCYSSVQKRRRVSNSCSHIIFSPKLISVVIFFLLVPNK